MNFAGDSTDPYSVIIDSALGLLGAPPKSNEAFLEQIRWMQDYLSNKPAPAYPFAIDRQLADAGRAVFEAECARCHASERTGTVVPLAEVGTSRDRIETWNERARPRPTRWCARWASNGRAWSRRHSPATWRPFSTASGCAPYLHNGSVPTLRDLLEAPESRRRASAAATTSMTLYGSVSSPAGGCRAHRQPARHHAEGRRQRWPRIRHHTVRQ